MKQQKECILNVIVIVVAIDCSCIVCWMSMPRIVRSSEEFNFVYLLHNKHHNITP